METILTLTADYGTLIYLLLFGYCALKSGSLPLFGGYAAQAGALDVGLVATVVFAGGYLGDEMRFAVARRYGAGFLASKPRLSALMEKATAILDACGWAYIFLYRYSTLPLFKGNAHDWGAAGWPDHNQVARVYHAERSLSPAVDGAFGGFRILLRCLIEAAVVSGWGAR